MTTPHAELGRMSLAAGVFTDDAHAEVKEHDGIGRGSETYSSSKPQPSSPERPKSVTLSHQDTNATNGDDTIDCSPGAIQAARNSLFGGGFKSYGNPEYGHQDSTSNSEQFAGMEPQTQTVAYRSVGSANNMAVHHKPRPSFDVGGTPLTIAEAEALGAIPSKHVQGPPAGHAYQSHDKIGHPESGR